jgi:CheY-like chemotaxis protein
MAGYRERNNSTSFGHRMDREASTLRILAVEDSASARKLFQGLLLRLGVGLPDLRFAANSAEALQLYTQWRPDLVFVDIELRNAPPAQPVTTAAPAAANAPAAPAPVDGDELARQLLERNPRLNLVVVTVFDRDNPRVKALVQRGAADVIVKPVLAARVQEVLERFAGPRPNDRRRA